MQLTRRSSDLQVSCISHPTSHGPVVCAPDVRQKARGRVATTNCRQRGPASSPAAACVRRCANAGGGGHWRRRRSRVVALMSSYATNRLGGTNPLCVSPHSPREQVTRLASSPASSQARRCVGVGGGGRLSKEEASPNDVTTQDVHTAIVPVDRAAPDPPPPAGFRRPACLPPDGPTAPKSLFFGKHYMTTFVQRRTK